jgi:two-component system CheB/CheR fusion protein
LTNEFAVTLLSDTSLDLKKMLDKRPVSNLPGTELVDCIELPVLAVDCDLALISFNPAAARLLSLTQSDRGRHLHSIQVFQGMRDVEDLCQHVIASGLPYRVEVADGAGSWFSLSITRYKKTKENINGAVLSLTNVTAFRESLRRAIEEREYTKAVVNTIMDALAIVDGELRVRAGNQAFYSLFQTSPERSQGAHFYELGGCDWDIPQLQALLNANPSQHGYLGSLECDHEFSHVGRRTLLLNARRLIRGSHSEQMTLITMHDITERKRAMEALRESEEVQRRLAAIVESSDDAIVSEDLNGIVTSWNPAAEKMFSYSSSEMIGRPITTIMPPELQSDEQRILETVARGEQIQHFQTVRLTKRGERIDVSLTISPVRDEAGRVIGAAKIARDITQEKKTEQALRTNEKLASVGRLAATVAHEINNPLAAVINLIYLANGCAIPEDAREYLNTADEELNRISQITKQTLGFYRESTAPAAVRVGTMLDPILSMFGTRARNKGIEIRPEIRRDPEINARAGEIRQVIANLLSNSIDAVDSGGLIRIRVGSTRLNGRLSPGTRITIADSGPGIPYSVRSRLFEPFFTTKKDVGTGLGLWVCSNIVKRHHGSIRVKSSTTPGRSWTVFTVFLPSDRNR